jgi:hypothetical protein
MNQGFKHWCTRRSGVRSVNIEEGIPLGAGSGGDDPDPEVDGARMVTAEKTLVLGGNHVAIQAQDPTPPATAGTPLITLLAGDLACTEGRIEMHAISQVRISTSGETAGIKMHQPSIDGLSLQVGETQEIYMKRGILPTDNFIDICDENIAIDGGSLPVIINSDVSITLSVANGASSITLTPTGITIQGAQLTVQGMALVGITAPMVTIN